MVIRDSSTSSKSPEDYESEYIAIATIGRPVGLDGWCRVFTFGNTLEKIELPYSLRAGIKNPTVTVMLKELGQDTKGYRGLFEGYGSRESIDTLKKFQLFVEKDKLPLHKHDEFYHFELEGMKVFCNESKECIGKVIHVHNYPTVDALEVKKISGCTFIVPMTEEAIKRIDRNSREIIISDSTVEELL